MPGEPSPTKKDCVSCGKQIPTVALNCVFCSARQPVSTMEEALTSLAEERGASPRVVEANGASAEVPAKLQVTAAMQAITLPSAAETAALEAVPVGPKRKEEVTPMETPAVSLPLPWPTLGRGVMAVGGLVLMLVFFLPWNGASSWQLLQTLGGAQFVRQLFYLTGGVVLFAAAMLPVPFAFRAAVGGSVAALPMILCLTDWIGGRGVLTGVAFLVLSAAHLLRSRLQEP